MRAFGLVALLVLAGCSSQSAASPTSPVQSASAQTACKLPVYWLLNRPSPPGLDAHAGFVSVPDGTVTDVGVLPQLSLSLPGLASVQSQGATYESATNQWVHADRTYLSSDGKRVAY